MCHFSVKQKSGRKRKPREGDDAIKSEVQQAARGKGSGGVGGGGGSSNSSGDGGSDPSAAATKAKKMSVGRKDRAGTAAAVAAGRANENSLPSSVVKTR